MAIAGQTVKKYETVADMVQAVLADGGDTSQPKPSREDALEFIRQADVGLRNFAWAITPHNHPQQQMEWEHVLGICAMAQIVAKGDDEVAQAAISHLARRGSEHAYRGITSILCPSERPYTYKYSVFGEWHARSWYSIKKEVPLDVTYPHLAQFALEAICSVEFRNVDGFVAANRVSAECVAPTARDVRSAFEQAVKDEDVSQAKMISHQYQQRLLETSLGFLQRELNHDMTEMMVKAITNTNYMCSHLPVILPLQAIFARRAAVYGQNNLWVHDRKIGEGLEKIVEHRQVKWGWRNSGNDWYVPIINCLRESGAMEDRHIAALETYLFETTQELVASAAAEKHKDAAQAARPAVNVSIGSLTRK